MKTLSPDAIARLPDTLRAEYELPTPIRDLANKYHTHYCNIKAKLESLGAVIRPPGGARWNQTRKVVPATAYSSKDCGGIRRHPDGIPNWMYSFSTQARVAYDQWLERRGFKRYYDFTK